MWVRALLVPWKSNGGVWCVVLVQVSYSDAPAAAPAEQPQQPEGEQQPQEGERQ